MINADSCYLPAVLLNPVHCTFKNIHQNVSVHFQHFLMIHVSVALKVKGQYLNCITLKSCTGSSYLPFLWAFFMVTVSYLNFSTAAFSYSICLFN